MRKYWCYPILIAIVLVVCLPVTVFAAGELSPKRALIYGALINSTTSSSRAAVVYQVNSTDFTIKPTADMSAVNQISLFFVVPTNITTFSLSITCLDTRLSQINDGSFSTNTALYNWEGSSASNVSYISGVTRTKSTVDGYGVYNWDYYANSSSNRNCVMVNLPLYITVVDDSNYYNFRVNYLNVNGQAIEDIAVTETNEGFAEDIANLSQNENEWWQRVVLPDYEDYLDNPDIINQSGTYRLAIKEISFNNFLVPGLISIVFIMAFYGFLLYGKKG